MSSLAFNLATSGDNTVIPGIPATNIHISGIFFTANTSTIVTFTDGATNLTGAMSFPAGSQMNHPANGGGVTYFDLGVNMPFVIHLSGSLPSISGYIYYNQS